MLIAIICLLSLRTHATVSVSERMQILESELESKYASRPIDGINAAFFQEGQYRLLLQSIDSGFYTPSDLERLTPYNDTHLTRADFMQLGELCCQKIKDFSYRYDAAGGFYFDLDGINSHSFYP